MNFKKLAPIIALSLIISACTAPNYHFVKYKNVDVVELKSEVRPLYYHYLGTIMPKEIKKFSFQTGGVIQSIPVSVGDFVKSGDLLASLNVQKYDIAVSSSKQAENQAYNNYTKAKESYDFLKKELDDLKILLETGAAS